MSEFRRDLLSDHWVIIAPNRASRPEQFAADSPLHTPQRCPFCRGHEQDTPPAVASVAETVSPAENEWQVRVVPNKYPAVVDADMPTRPTDGFYETQRGIGVHEVIIESPEHIVSISELDERRAALVFRTYGERLKELGEHPRLAYGQIFKNSGAAAGASLEHSHSQLIATAVVPTQIQREMSKSMAYHLQHGRCVFCAMLARELDQGARIVAESPHFVAFCPFASQFPYEIWIMPREHGCRFEDTEPGNLAEFSSLVRDVILRIEAALQSPAFNYLIHTAPFHTSSLAYFHWHLEFSPRLTKTAGFEWGAGDYINVISPEDAACTLRAAGE